MDVERDNARIGYQAAISLATHEGSNVWVRYGLMLVVHTFIFSVFGFTAGLPQPTKSLIWIGLSLAGMVLCVLWWVVNEIGFRYFFYWIFSARELEEHYLEPIHTVGRAFPLAGEGDVSVAVGGVDLRLPITGRDRARVVLVSRMIICLFGVLHGALFVWQLIDLWR
jgi:hypothetical protein